MATTLPIPFDLCFLQLLHSISYLLQVAFRRLFRPQPASFVRGALADLTCSRAELIAENAPLRQQVVILHREIKRPQLTRRDRFWLLVLASQVADWKQAPLIIQPDTLLRWHRQGIRLFWTHKTKGAKPGMAGETIELIQRMAKENLLWGDERIRGELLKLGIPVAKRTLQKYMHQARLPRPSGQTWSTFLKNHAQDIWACDFLPLVDLFFRQVFLSFIIELSSRRVVHFGVTRNPSEAWVTQQLREATPHGQVPKYLIRDNDNKFGARFDGVVKRTGIEVVKIPCRAPRAIAICERFVGSVRRECLDRPLIS